MHGWLTDGAGVAHVRYRDGSRAVHGWLTDGAGVAHGWCKGGL